MLVTAGSTLITVATAEELMGKARQKQSMKTREQLE